MSGLGLRVLKIPYSEEKSRLSHFANWMGKLYNSMKV